MVLWFPERTTTTVCVHRQMIITMWASEYNIKKGFCAGGVRAESGEVNSDNARTEKRKALSLFQSLLYSCATSRPNAALFRLSHMV